MADPEQRTTSSGVADPEQRTTSSGVAPSLGETNDVHAPAETSRDDPPATSDPNEMVDTPDSLGGTGGRDAGGAG